MARITFTLGQEYLYLGVLKELGIPLDIPGVHVAMEESVFTCYLADLSADSGTRLAKYGDFQTDAPQQRMPEAVESIQQTLIDSLSSCFGVGKDASFQDSIMTTIQLLKNHREFIEAKRGYGDEDRAMVAAMVVGTALFGSTLMMDESLEMSELMENLDIGVEELDLIRQELNDLVSPEKKIDGEDVIKG